MLRTLILLAVGYIVVRKLGGESRGHARTPFPTSSRPPEGYGS